ncbi:MAG TPA: histidine phosphatase family protein [Ruminococcus sp.]|nr:histidine phosphatase family protein [Ruminococcus sp.]
MAYIYFTRHGQTTWNVANKICGATDVPLTEAGREQAEKLGEIIAREYKDIDLILYSPLIRAADTARIIAETASIPLQCEPRLKEQCFGIWEGTPRDSEDFAAVKENFLDSFGGGESMMRTGQRIYNLLDELRSSRKVVLLVAHNGIARFVRSYFEDMTNREFARNGIKNCEICRFDYKE